MKNTKAIIRPFLVTIAILSVPFFGNLYVDGWNWSWTDFVLLGVILFGAGLAYEFAGRYAKKGVTIGFVCGEIVAVGVIAVLRYLNPDEDIAGLVIIIFLMSGLFFASMGYAIQKHIMKK